jgi:hypothetical protein
MLIPPAVGEPLAEAGVRNLTAELGPEAAPASRVPLATARSMSRNSACMSTWSERVIVAANFIGKRVRKESSSGIAAIRR